MTADVKVRLFLYFYNLKYLLGKYLDIAGSFHPIRGSLLIIRIRNDPLWINIDKRGR